jgi:hypothetical protein
MDYYEEIKKLAAADLGVASETIKTCFVAHVKEALGYPIEPAHNRADPDERKHPCPPRYQPSIAKAIVQVYGLPARPGRRNILKTA